MMYHLSYLLETRLWKFNISLENLVFFLLIYDMFKGDLSIYTGFVGVGHIYPYKVSQVMVYNCTALYWFIVSYLMVVKLKFEIEGAI